MMMKRTNAQNYAQNYAIIICLLIWISGCGQQSEPSLPPSASVVPLQTLTARQQAQKQLAIDVKDQLFESLLGELTKSMSENGPAKSISVCKTRAPEIAMRVSKETGVRIGRTSFSLRNDSNTPPDWAVRFVTNKTQQPIHVALPDEELGSFYRLDSKRPACSATGQQQP